VLTLEGKCSYWRAKPAHFVGHLPPGPVPYDLLERATQDVLAELRGEQVRNRVRPALTGMAQKLYNSGRARIRVKIYHKPTESLHRPIKAVIAEAKAGLRNA
jgi:hypothetical protein